MFFPERRKEKVFFLKLNEESIIPNSFSVIEKEENPRSSVIPRSLLCGLLSKHAVEATVLSTRAITKIK